MTTQTEALTKMLDALRLPCDRWNKTQVIKVQEAIKAGEEALMSQSDGAQPAVAEQHKQEPSEYMMEVTCTKCGATESGVLKFTTPPQSKPLPLPKGSCASEWGGRETGPCLYTAEQVLEILAAHGIKE